MNTTTRAHSPVPTSSPDGAIDITTRQRRARRWTTIGAALAAAGTAAPVVATTNGGLELMSNGPGQSLLVGAPPVLTGVLLAIAGAAVTAGLLWLRGRVGAVARGDSPAGWGAPRTVVAIGTLAVAITVLATVCDSMPLAVAGYLPLLLVGSLFSPEMRDALAVAAQSTVTLQLGLVAATLVVVGGVLASLSSLRGAAPLPDWLQPASAARWGRVATVIAVLAPLAYAFTRVVWVLGWPLGFDADAYEAAGGDLRSGLALAAGATLGAVLTTGLVRPWGERFWGWVPVLGGRPVPVWLAVVPASVVAALLLPAGVAMINAAIGGGGIATVLSDLSANWAAIGATFLWPLWSLALAAATLAYAIRRGVGGAS